jgi:hypothetical protein
MLKTIKNGIYQHYKKLPYQVLGVVQHSETLEYMVYYQALYGERGFWVRPTLLHKGLLLELRL